MILALLFFGLYFNSVQAQTSSIDDLHLHPRWLRLLHYKKRTFFSGYKSFADSNHFFISKNGKYNPKEELIATIKAFKNHLPDKRYPKWHPQCAFPARFKFIKNHSKETFPKIDCPDFNWWRNRIDAKSISIVFSSYYTGNPASIFGHTLLKLNSDKTKGKLHDFAINFAAETGPEKGLSYIIKGIFGGYHGQFSTSPYYMLLNDYVQGENRDMWEYNLKLSNDNIDWIIKHIWELKMNSFFNYFFFDENCSYMLLKIIEVGKLDWNISHGFYFFTLPIDTVKRLKEVDAIRSIHFRPSYQKKMMERYRILKSKEKLLFQHLQEKKIDPNKVKSPAILDAYSSYLRYQKFKNAQNLNYLKNILIDINKTNIARAKLKVKSNSIIKELEQRHTSNDPILSHHSSTVRISQGRSNQYKNFNDFYFRFAVHDILNNEKGLPEFSNLNFFSFKARYFSRLNKLFIKRLSIIDMETFPHFNTLTKTPAWGVSLQLKNPRDFDSSHKLLLSSRASYGLSRHVFDNTLNLHSLLLSDFQYGSILRRNNFRIRLGLKFGSIFKLNDVNKFFLQGIYLLDPIKNFDKKEGLELRAGIAHTIGQSFEMRLYYSKIKTVEFNWKTQIEQAFSLSYFY